MKKKNVILSLVAVVAITASLISSGQVNPNSTNNTELSELVQLNSAHAEAYTWLCLGVGYSCHAWVRPGQKEWSRY